MSIKRKVKAVERIFKSLEEEIRNLKKQTGIQCLTGCGKCCTKPDIDASPLEYLPLAFEWFKLGIAAEKLEYLRENKSLICSNYAPLSLIDQNSGNCSIYQYRGLVCRLFGNASSRDKNGDLKFVTCKLIKENDPRSIELANDLLKEKKYVPVFSDYYRKLYQVDFKLASQIHPINTAIAIALEEVMSYYAYRPFTSTKKAG
jgi:Fe-S-cluster containining protein